VNRFTCAAGCRAPGVVAHSRRPASSASRWFSFNVVGIVGAGVQLATLRLCLELPGIHYMAAAAIAVETAILHNFIWHRRWTWRDRPAASPSAVLLQLARFHGCNGVVSIVGHMILMPMLVTAAGFAPVGASFITILLCSAVNFALANHVVFRGRAARVACAAALALVLAGTDTVEAAGPRPETLAAWQRYVETTENRIRGELDAGRPFIADDSRPDGRAGMSTKLRSGEVVIARLESRNAAGSTIEVPSGEVHHWRGTIFIPGASLEEVLDRAKNPDRRHLPDDVLEASVLSRDADRMRLFLKLTRSMIVSATYNTEHDVRYVSHGPGRASSSSVSVRIAELQNPGTPSEREKTPDEDRGFLWRLNSYWRYEAVDGGVVAQCESISLSRNVPMGLGSLIEPLVDRVARESMLRTLESLLMPEGDH
jgi:putative flippase GtrA